MIDPFYWIVRNFLVCEVNTSLALFMKPIKNDPAIQSILIQGNNGSINQSLNQVVRFSLFLAKWHVLLQKASLSNDRQKRKKSSDY